jgi:NAD(P)-dependent dehydrogenase (short-subunit alcohol dehydrogenase family)
MSAMSATWRRPVSSLRRPAIRPWRRDWISATRPSSTACERVADELGRVDILVNNAAIFESATWDDLDFDLWRRIMTVNLNGPMLMCKAFLPLMADRGWGRIINMASAAR